VTSQPPKRRPQNNRLGPWDVRFWLKADMRCCSDESASDPKRTSVKLAPI
jgi:hypothetical protein